jgi:DNA recombination protein RmuC
MIASAVLAIMVALLLMRLLSQKARIGELEKQAAEAVELRSRLSAAEVRAGQVPQLEARVQALTESLNEEIRAREAREGEIRVLKEAHEARLEELHGARKELEDRFAALASGVLDKSAENFLKLASERFRNHERIARDELEKRKSAIENLVRPLSERLEKFDEKIKDIEQTRNEAYGAIRQQVKALAEGQMTLNRETRKLVQALRAPKTRGRWGEMQLKQVFEMAGMAEHVDYSLEHHMETDRGVRRPDAVVRIPGGKSIVVDAKTPLEAYLDALEAETPEQQQAHLGRHAMQVREHVKLLASKNYQDAIAETPDFVVMFIPGETFVGAAVEVDPELIEFAFERKVLIATPTTLMALVKAIAYGWQQEKMARNAHEVQRIAKELYDRLNTFSEHLGRVGRALGSSVEAYNRAVGSLESRVLPSARKFENMGVVTTDTEISSPDTVEREARRIAHDPDE